MSLLILPEGPPLVHRPSGMHMVPLWVIDDRSVWLRSERDGTTRPWKMETYISEFDIPENYFAH